MDRVAAFVLAGGKGGDFGVLSDHRTKAAFPVAGLYRIIDFVLSNLCHAGVRQAGIVIQYMPASLMEHIGSGRAWEFGMADRHLRFMTPFVGVDEIRWFHGTGDAIAKNMNLLEMSDLDDVMVLSGEHVYRMDYRRLIEHHRTTNADVTFAGVVIPPEKQNPRFGNIVTREGGRVEAFLEKPDSPVSSIVSMGIYVFKRQVLLDLIARHQLDGVAGECSLPGDILQPHIGRLNTQCYIHSKPWHYLANLREYYDFHMQLARGEIDLFEKSWDVITSFTDRELGWRTPAYFAPSAVVDSSVISSGSQIEGEVINSVLSPGVTVARGASVRNSVIFHDVKIGEGCRIEHAIIDKDVVLGSGARVGLPDGDTPGRGTDDPNYPITVLPKGGSVRAGEVIPAGALYDASVLI